MGEAKSSGPYSPCCRSWASFSKSTSRLRAGTCCHTSASLPLLVRRFAPGHGRGVRVSVGAFARGQEPRRSRLRTATRTHANRRNGSHVDLAYGTNLQVRLAPASHLAGKRSSRDRCRDKMLREMICYPTSMLDINLLSHIGGPIQDCRLLLFTDSDFGGNSGAPKSTTGLSALAGPSTFSPIAATSDGQTGVGHRSAGADTTAMEDALRVVGLAALYCCDVVIPLCSPYRGDSRVCLQRCRRGQQCRRRLPQPSPVRQ